MDLVHQRKVTEEEGRELAGKLGIGYMETSAKDPPFNVDAAFHQIVRVLRAAPPDEPRPPPGRKTHRAAALRRPFTRCAIL